MKIEVGGGGVVSNDDLYVDFVKVIKLRMKIKYIYYMSSSLITSFTMYI